MDSKNTVKLVLITFMILIGSLSILSFANKSENDYVEYTADKNLEIPIITYPNNKQKINLESDTILEVLPSKDVDGLIVEISDGELKYVDKKISINDRQYVNDVNYLMFPIFQNEEIRATKKKKLYIAVRSFKYRDDEQISYSETATIELLVFKKNLFNKSSQIIVNINDDDLPEDNLITKEIEIYRKNKLEKKIKFEHKKFSYEYSFPYLLDDFDVQIGTNTRDITINNILINSEEKDPNQFLTVYQPGKATCINNFTHKQNLVCNGYFDFKYQDGQGVEVHELQIITKGEVKGNSPLKLYINYYPTFLYSSTNLNQKYKHFGSLNLDSISIVNLEKQIINNSDFVPVEISVDGISHKLAPLENHKYEYKIIE